MKIKIMVRFIAPVLSIRPMLLVVGPILPASVLSVVLVVKVTVLRFS